MNPSPEQVSGWRENFESKYTSQELFFQCGEYSDRYIQHEWQGYLRRCTEQAAEIAELKAKLAEVMPSNDPLIVWSVSSEAGFTLFKTLEDAQRYVGQFSASIGGGLYISETAVFGNIVKD